MNNENHHETASANIEPNIVVLYSLPLAFSHFEGIRSINRKSLSFAVILIALKQSFILPLVVKQEVGDKTTIKQVLAKLSPFFSVPDCLLRIKEGEYIKLYFPPQHIYNSLNVKFEIKHNHDQRSAQRKRQTQQ